MSPQVLAGHDARQEPVGRAVVWTAAITALGGLLFGFFLMGFLSLAAVAYCWKKVPETEGLTLEEIEREMA